MRIEEAIDIIRANYPPENYSMLRDALETLIDEVHRPKEITAEQREALEYAIEALHHTHCPECETLLMRADPAPAISAIRDLLSGSVPAWEATDERIPEEYK